MKRHTFQNVAFLIVIITLCSCASAPKGAPGYFASRHISAFSDYTNFQHCRAYGCREIDTLALEKKDWKEIERIFKPTAKSAVEERERIASAIGAFETKVGAINGTSEDVYGTFKKVGMRQHDCVDESTNTTIYLSLLHNAGLLKFHDVGAPDARVPVIHYAGTWPHQTAVITERVSGQKYAVDSWFHSNGYPAEIEPLEVWKHGWRPVEIKK